jgi:hypothetical protein
MTSEQGRAIPAFFMSAARTSCACFDDVRASAELAFPVGPS